MTVGVAEVVETCDTWPVPESATQMLPLLSTVRPWGWAPGGSDTVVNRLALVSTEAALRAVRARAAAAAVTDGGMNFTTWLLAESENQSAPSGVATMPVGAGVTPPAGVGMLHSVMAPAGVIRASWPAAVSVNHRLPSTWPRAMPWGRALAVVTGKVTALPAVVMRPMALAPWRVYQRAPSGPAAMPVGEAPWAPYSLRVLPSRVSTPILAVPCSVNHMRPSGPAVMPVGALAGSGRVTREGTWVTAGMTPIWPAVWLVNQMLPSGPVAMPRGADWGARVTWLVWPTAAVTVRVAALLVAVPWLLLATSSNWARLSSVEAAGRL